MRFFREYPHLLAYLGITCLVVFLSGCQSTYYDAMEKIGYHKRDIMVERIEDTQGAQEAAQQQFQTALEHFQHVVAFDGGDLESVYNDLNSEYKNSIKAAEKVRSRIQSVKDVSEALFDEWDEEISQYSNKRLQQASQKQLNSTVRSYKQMLGSLEKSEKQMQPILDAFHDQVLFLKHNLNARAISALKGEFGRIKSDINQLVRDMRASIDQSRKFVETLKQ